MRAADQRLPLVLEALQARVDVLASLLAAQHLGERLGPQRRRKALLHSS